MSKFSFKSYTRSTETSFFGGNPEKNPIQKSPKNPTSWKLAQNNVIFFVLPSTTRYQCVLLWRKNSKMLKNENLNWHRSFSKKLKIPKKSQKPLFLRWVIFDIFLQSVFCICILYFVFLSFCLFIFLSFFNFVLLLIGRWVSLTLGAVNLRQPRCVRPSQSIQIVIIIIKWTIRTQKRPKMSLGVLHANTRHKYANTQIRRRSIEHDDAVRHFWIDA